MRTSDTTASTGVLGSRARAASPSVAVTAWWPSRSKSAVRRRRRGEESSTMRMRIPTTICRSPIVMPATIRATMRSADVVVIGGGCIGASTAFHLTTLGVREVHLVERRHLAAGATGKSGALVRMHYTNEAESRLAFESLKVFQDFDAIVGGRCGFEPVGFVQLVGPEHRPA